MANFTAKDVNELRKNTGVGMMDCKKALTEADGDVEKAMLILREKGLENDLQANTEMLMQICTDTLVRNLRLWRVQELVSR